MRSQRFALSLVCVCCFVHANCSPVIADEPSLAEMRDVAQVAVDRFAKIHPDRSLIVGVLAGGERAFVAAGVARGDRKTDEHTLFEIGSVSKTFTGLTLADMIEQGQISADDTIRKFIPETVALKPSVAAISLEQLATHTSGLPRIAGTTFVKALFSTTPYGGSRERLHFDLSLLDVQPTKHPEYSNLGVGLLGDILSRVEDTDYETLIKRRITGPLQMDDTVENLSEDQQARFAVGYFGSSEAKPWSKMGTAVGAGGLRSTADDLLTYAAAIVDDDCPLREPIRLALRPRVEYESNQWNVGLCWHSIRQKDLKEDAVPRIVFHTGATYSHTSALYIDTENRRAAVVLLNTLRLKKAPSPAALARKVLMLSERPSGRKAPENADTPE